MSIQPGLISARSNRRIGAGRVCQDNVPVRIECDRGDPARAAAISARLRILRLSLEANVF